MKRSQVPHAIVLERMALVDRIKHYEASARRFDEDWGVTKGNAVEHIAYARTRLDHIDSIIAGLARPAHP